MMIAFSLTNRPRLGQAKGGLGLNPHRHCEEAVADEAIPINAKEIASPTSGSQ